MAEKGEIGGKKWVSRCKKRVIGLEKFRAYNQTRKAKWCKMPVVCLKTDNSEGVEGYKKCRFTYFLASIFARTVRKLGQYCKIKDSNLSF